MVVIETLQRSRESVLADIAQHPDKHRHTAEQLEACCLIFGTTDMEVMAAHLGLGKHGALCDVSSGPCTCGTTHREVEKGI